MLDCRLNGIKFIWFIYWIKLKSIVSIFVFRIIWNGSWIELIKNLVVFVLKKGGFV